MNKTLSVKGHMIPLISLMLCLTVFLPQIRPAAAQDTPAVHIGAPNETTMTFTIGNHVSFWWEGFPAEVDSGWWSTNNTYKYCIRDSAAPPENDSEWKDANPNTSTSQTEIYHPMKHEQIYYVHIKDANDTTVCTSFKCYQIPVSFVDANGYVETSHKFLNAAPHLTDFKVNFKTFTQYNDNLPPGCTISGYASRVEPTPPRKAASTAGLSVYRIGKTKTL